MYRWHIQLVKKDLGTNTTTHNGENKHWRSEQAKHYGLQKKKSVALQAKEVRKMTKSKGKVAKKITIVDEPENITFESVMGSECRTWWEKVEADNPLKNKKELCGEQLHHNKWYSWYKWHIQSVKKIWELTQQHTMVKLSIGNPSKGNIIESKKKKFVALQAK